MVGATDPAGADAGGRAGSLIDHAPGLVQPGRVQVDASLPAEAARRRVRLAQQLYTFWNTGDEAHLERAAVAGFKDNTPPPGRQQGRDGVAAASASFRAAIPDLSCELADLIVTGNRITARQVYRGHFTGTYEGVRGRGQAVRFNAIDILRVGRTKIVEDWHLEDTAALTTQLGFTSTPPATGARS